MSKVLSNMNTPEENMEYLKSILPLWENGTNKGKINWEKSIGNIIEYEYKWKDNETIKGILTIINFDGRNLYFDGIKKHLYTSSLFIGRLGRILGISSSDTFKHYKGKILNDIIIIDRKIIKKGEIQPNGKVDKATRKWYQYRCFKCNTTGWIIEGSLDKNSGCSACNSNKTRLGANTIWDKARWMCDLGVSEEDAKKYRPYSEKTIEVICPYCGRKFSKRIDSIYINHTINCMCCDKGFSYPEKFVYSMLEQLNIDFEFQYSSKWTNNKRYDFYIPKLNLILETHGGQHGKFITSGELTLVKKVRSTSFSNNRDDIKIDAEKCWLAYDNGMENYIQLDCYYSDMEYIKNNILNSELANVFDLSNINWNKCEEFSFKNIVKEVCNYWHNHREINSEDIFVKDLIPIFKLSGTTIVKYLKKGTKLRWCNYDAKEELQRGRIKNSGCNSKRKVYCLELDKEFPSIIEAQKELGIYNITACCKGKYSYAGKHPITGEPLHWEFIE